MAVGGWRQSCVDGETARFDFASTGKSGGEAPEAGVSPSVNGETLAVALGRGAIRVDRVQRRPYSVQPPVILGASPAPRELSVGANIGDIRQQ
jgi:hypothetical protein